ncbi:MAG: hypothetical protein A2Y05_01510 [Omnitrophica WOR_2 bacterium GWA2_53_43]|nr:MAG: hypothetical protein A2Y05_01510 [Omnitrophica WOR_2 bacterium GWA2_53_43]
MTNINGKRHAAILAYFLHLHYIPFNGKGEENPLRFALSGNAVYFLSKPAGGHFILQRLLQIPFDRKGEENPRGFGLLGKCFIFPE